MSILRLACPRMLAAGTLLLLVGCGGGETANQGGRPPKTGGQQTDKGASGQARAPKSPPGATATSTAPENLLRRARALLPRQGPIDVRWALNLKDRTVSKFWLPAERISPSESMEADFLLLQTSRNDLVAIHRRSGKVAWWSHLTGPLTGRPAFTKYAVYLIVRSHIICLELYSGEVIWRLNLPFPPSGGPSVLEAARGKPIIYAAGLDRKIYCLEVEGGLWPPQHGAGSLTRKDFVMQRYTISILWRYPTYSQIMGNVIAWDQQVYAADAKHTVYAIRSTALSVGKPKHVQLYRTQGPVTATPTLVGQFLFVPCRDRNLYCLRRQDISPSWHYASGALLEQSAYPLVDHFINRTTIVIKCGARGPLTGLRDTDGKVLWEIDNGEAVVGLFVNPENELTKRAIMVVRNRDRTLSGHYASDGKQIWRVPAPGFSRFCVNARDELVYTTAGGGRMVVALQRRK